MEETKVSNFTLPNETVVVRFIKRKRGMAANVADNHIISGGMLPLNWLDDKSILVI